jgi:hypothetical protein
MEVKMKKCSNCGYIELSNQEKEIFDMLPNNSLEMADKMDVSFKHINALLSKMKKNKLVKIKKKIGHLNVWDRAS